LKVEKLIGEPSKNEDFEVKDEISFILRKIHHMWRNKVGFKGKKFQPIKEKTQGKRSK